MYVNSIACVYTLLQAMPDLPQGQFGGPRYMARAPGAKNHERKKRKKKKNRKKEQNQAVILHSKYHKILQLPGALPLGPHQLLRPWTQRCEARLHRAPISTQRALNVSLAQGPGKGKSGTVCGIKFTH